MRTPKRAFRYLNIAASMALLLSIHSASAFYDPTVQRWITRDPRGQAGGLNLYSCLGSDPINKVDAFGECPLVLAAVPPLLTALGITAETAGAVVVSSALAGGAAYGVGTALTLPRGAATALSPGVYYGGGAAVNAAPTTLVTTIATTAPLIKIDTKSWEHESPNPEKTGRRSDRKNRPDGKQLRDPQEPPEPPDWWNRPRKPHENTPNIDNSPYEGPPKDALPARCTR